MGNDLWILLPVALGCIYLAAVLAVIDGAIRAIRERYLPPWVIGLAAAALLVLVNELLGALLDLWAGVVAVVVGVLAGAVCGLRRRRLAGRS